MNEKEKENKTFDKSNQMSRQQMKELHRHMLEEVRKSYPNEVYKLESENLKHLVNLLIKDERLHKSHPKEMLEIIKRLKEEMIE